MGIVLGKGFGNQCYPYQSYDIFGMPFDVSDELSGTLWDWKCDDPLKIPAVIKDSSNLFDVSSITQYHEVLVCLAKFKDVKLKTFVKFEWKNADDDKTLFVYRYIIIDPGEANYDKWDWYWIVAWLGYCPWEINKNGLYSVNMTVWFENEDNPILSDIQYFNIIGVSGFCGRNCGRNCGRG